jgi:hypothetical protein
VRGFLPVDGEFEALLEPEEARVLASLAAQLSALLGEAADDEHLSQADPAVARLLPDAYRHDEEAAAEWRRLSRRALAERKGAFAARFAADLADAAAASETTRIRIDETGALDWMRAIGDLRLVLAERMGITEPEDDESGGFDDDDAAAAGDAERAEREGLVDLYQWLAWMQDDLVQVLDDTAGQTS